MNIVFEFVIVVLLVALVTVYISKNRRIRKKDLDMYAALEKANQDGYREGLRFVSRGTKEMYEGLLKNKNENIDQLIQELQELKAMQKKPANEKEHLSKAS